MKQYVGKVVQVLHAKKLIGVFLAVATVSVLSFSSVAAASTPDYFDVQKPTSSSVCEGGSWVTIHQWGWWGWKHVGMRRVQIWVPNWQKLGFDSHGQCVRYVTTAQPTSKKDCRQHWWLLGFSNRGDCLRYLRLHGGGGYGGDAGAV